MLEAVSLPPKPQSEPPVVAPSLLCLVELSGSLNTLGTLRWFPLATPARLPCRSWRHWVLKAVYTWLLNSDLTFQPLSDSHQRVRWGLSSPSIFCNLNLPFSALGQNAGLEKVLPSFPLSGIQRAQGATLFLCDFRQIAA